MGDKARLKGAGGGHGTGGFIAQRGTAMALVLLGPWFIISVALASRQGENGVAAFFANPLHGALTGAFLIAGAWHMQLGMLDIIEDYIGKPGTRKALEFLNILVAAAAALAGLWAIAKISFGV